MNNEINNLNYKKYLNYKKKYLDLKDKSGGKILLSTDKLDNDKIASSGCIENEQSEYPYMVYYNGTQYRISFDLFIKNRYSEKLFPKIFWVLDYNKIYNVENSNYYIDNFKVKYYWCHPTPRNLDDIIDIQLPIDRFDPENPYEYLFMGYIFGRQIDFFNSMYSNLINIFLCRKIQAWVDSKIALYSIENVRSILHATTQIYIFVNGNSNINNANKVHVKVKQKYLFWAFEKIIKNIGLLKNLVQAFKCEGDFRIHNFLNQDYVRSVLEDEYTIKGQKYKNEENPIIIFAFYPMETSNNINTVRDIINILKELFDDKYGIGVESDQIPRFNFKINDSVYFSFGNSTTKQDSLSDGTYTRFFSPTDYKGLVCTRLDPHECSIQNAKSKRIHNHEICKLNDEGRCVSNNTYQHNLLLDEDGLSIEDVYRRYGQEAEYIKLNV